MITTQMQKWGNSYGVRIPKAILDRMELEPGVQFEVREQDGAILLIPALARPTLADLLEKVTPENLHGEVDMGLPTGNETGG